MSKISPPELDERRSRGEDIFVLDVRPRKTYQRTHIDGSVNVPVYDDLKAGNEEALRQNLEKVPEHKTVVTVCKAGVVARTATSVLEEEGYEATTLAGGMRRWRGYENGTLGYRLRSLLGKLVP